MPLPIPMKGKFTSPANVWSCNTANFRSVELSFLQTTSFCWCVKFILQSCTISFLLEKIGIWSPSSNSVNAPLRWNYYFTRHNTQNDWNYMLTCIVHCTAHNFRCSRQIMHRRLTTSRSSLCRLSQNLNTSHFKKILLPNT